MSLDDKVLDELERLEAEASAIDVNDRPARNAAWGKYEEALAENVKALLAAARREKKLEALLREKVMTEPYKVHAEPGQPCKACDNNRSWRERVNQALEREALTSQEEE